MGDKEYVPQRSQLEDANFGLYCAYQRISELEHQLQQAHRAGWEQCHRQVNNLLNEAACGLLTREQFDKAIAAMEYKEPTND